MAGDWIKMRCALRFDPKVIAIARQIYARPRFSAWLTIDQYDDAAMCDVALRHCVTGALHSVWSAANEHAINGVIVGADLRWIDAVCGIDGFGDAMQNVGWASLEDDHLIFPKFDSNNTSAAERQRRYREKKVSQSDAQRDVTRCATGDAPLRPREEKRREEKNLGGVPPKNPPEAVAEFLSAWNLAEGSTRARGITDKRLSALRARLSETSWDWKAALAKFPLKCFTDDGGWRPNVDWFLKPDTVSKILEGAFDWSKKNGKSESRIGPGQSYDEHAGAKDPNFGKM